MRGLSQAVEEWEGVNLVHLVIGQLGDGFFFLDPM